MIMIRNGLALVDTEFGPITIGDCRVGTLIRLLRQLHGMSKQDILDRVNIASATLGKVEANITTPNAQQFIELDQIFGLDAGTLAAFHVIDQEPDRKGVTPLDMYDYQRLAANTIVGDQCKTLEYAALKLNGEAGEVAEAVGKYLRGDYDRDHLTALLLKELGDVQWYLALFCTIINTPLSEIGHINLDKLADRQRRSALQGSGDDR